MKGTDAVLGLVEDNGRYFLMDTFLSSYQAPPLDAVQNIHNMSVWRENGITHLQFHRFRTTSDPEYDFQFTDDHCPYFLFPIRGGVFNAVNKRMRKHEETPIVSKNRICVRARDSNKRKKIIEVPPPVRFPPSVPNKVKIPTRFKARPKLTQLIASTTTSTSTSTTTSSPTEFNKSPEPPTTNNINLNQNSNSRKPIDQPTTLPVDLNRVIDNDKSVDKSIDQLTSTKPPTTVDVRTGSIQSSTQSSVADSTTATSVSSSNVNLNNNPNSIETTNHHNKPPIEPKNEDKLEYGDEDEEPMNVENNINKKPITASTADDKVEQDGRISTDTNPDESKNALKSFSFDLQILNSASTVELNSTLVRQEAEKEFIDLTGFRQLKLITHKPISESSNKDGKPTSWIVDFEMQVHTEPDTNETDYLVYLQNALNETVTSGHIGNLMLDKSHYAQLKQGKFLLKIHLLVCIFYLSLFFIYNIYIIYMTCICVCVQCTVRK